MGAYFQAADFVATPFARRTEVRTPLTMAAVLIQLAPSPNKCSWFVAACSGSVAENVADYLIDYQRCSGCSGFFEIIYTSNPSPTPVGDSHPLAMPKTHK